MRPSLRIAVVVLAIGLLAVLAWLVLWPQEPMYQGKTLTAWLEKAYTDTDADYYPTSEDMTQVRTAVRAIQQIGPASTDVLLRFAVARDTRLTKSLLDLQRHAPFIHFHLMPAEHKHALASLGFRVLKGDAKPAVPELIRLLGNKDPDVRRVAAASLGAIGPEAGAAVPALSRLLGNGDQRLELISAESLGRIGPAAAPAVPALVAAMKRTNSLGTFQTSAWALGKIGPAARSAAPFLFLVMTNGVTSDMRLDAEVALVQINERPLKEFIEQLRDTSDPINWYRRAGHLIYNFPSNAEPAIPFLIAGLQQTNMEMQGASLSALGEIHSRPDLCVPAIADYVKYTASTNLSRALYLADALETLARFGTNARPAAPVVVDCLQDRNKYVRDQANETLRSIAPEELAKVGRK